jgi:large subunit ribosomal protein L9
MQLLLLDDVDGLGRSGDLVEVKPGYGRNYLMPQKKAVFADKHTLLMQVRLRQKREEKAAIDRHEAEQQASLYSGIELSTIVKVDPEGHMYGSVSAQDIVLLLAERGLHLERKQIILPQPIKALGKHSLSVRLKEEVTFSFSITIEADHLFHQQRGGAVQEGVGYENGE